jgi:hypothetical protein
VSGGGDLNPDAQRYQLLKINLIIAQNEISRMRFDLATFFKGTFETRW